LQFLLLTTQFLHQLCIIGGCLGELTLKLSYLLVSTSQLFLLIIGELLEGRNLVIIGFFELHRRINYGLLVFKLTPQRLNSTSKLSNVLFILEASFRQFAVVSPQLLHLSVCLGAILL
jgi:hypothetical protein